MMIKMMPKITQASLELSANRIHCRGDWTLDGISQLEKQIEQLIWPSSFQIILDGSTIKTMDTAGAWLLCRTQQFLQNTGYSVVLHNFTQKQLDLLQLIVNHQTEFQPTLALSESYFLAKFGQSTLQIFYQIIAFLAFVGETFLVLVQALLSPSRIRWKMLFANLHSAGLSALPIIGLLAFLTGVVLAYQGGTQLNLYGANIFIVDLVGITLLRELAPLLTAIMVAGRSGSAYTAQIGTMHVTEEIDALRSLGISPLELLVLPKLLALIILMPLLSAFADIVSILGSMLIANLAFGVSFIDFLERFTQAVSLTNYLIGIGKTPVFALVIALIGCYQGFQVKGQGTDQVGKQVTTSVVQAIFGVIVVDAVFAILLNKLGIGLL